MTKKIQKAKQVQEEISNGISTKPKRGRPRKASKALDINQVEY